ncbi:MAG: hypothetical protein JWL81_507, partial [Verrucomicrobiales bacterium]|nr:hypothetical protein [Verrucomicrobiales bacterium]
MSSGPEPLSTGTVGPQPQPPPPLSPPTAIWQPSRPKKTTWRTRFRAFLPLAGAAFVCSAALAAWRIWPAAFYFTDVSEPSDELLFHYDPSSPSQSGKTTAKSVPPPPATSNLFKEFAAEGFEFKAPADYWERIGPAESPFALLRPSFTLHRSESSPPSEFGLGACDFSLTTDILPDGSGADDAWASIPAVLALQSHFSCGIPERYEIILPGRQSLRCLRLVWEVPPAAVSGTPRRHLEMWIHQQGRIAWCMTGLMPGNNAAYSLTRVMQRLVGGFSVLETDLDVLQTSLLDRDLAGAAPLPVLPSPQPLYRWKSLPPNLSTWPGGRLSAPGADGFWASGQTRIALVCLPMQDLGTTPPSRLLIALRQIWPLLRGASIPATDPAAALPGNTLKLTLPATYEGKPALLALRLHPTPENTVIAVALKITKPPLSPHSPPDSADSVPPSALTSDSDPDSDPDSLLDLLQIGLNPDTPAPTGMPCILELPLLHALAAESRADGRLQEAATLEKALFQRSQRLEDLADACSALASAGKIEEATQFFDSAGAKFNNAPGWTLYRTLILARIGAGPRAHRQAMSLLADRKFPGSLAAPYLEALIDSQSWTEARAFASLLVRNDPDSVLWRLHYASILARTGERPKALAIIQATWQTWPDDAMLGIECVQKLLSLKQFQDANTLAARVAKHHPAHEQAQLLHGECLTFLGRTDDARLAYQQALKASPTSQAARDALTSLATTSAQADASYISPSLDPVPLPAALLENPAPGTPPKNPAPISSVSPDSSLPSSPPPALILSHITGHRQQRGRLPATTIRSKVLISNAEGMSQWNTLTFLVDPARERLSLHTLNVLDPSGKSIIAQGSPQDRYSLDTPDGMKNVHFPIPGLQPGCIIDYSLTLE